MNYIGKPIKFKLCDNFGFDIPENELYVPHYRKIANIVAVNLFAMGAVIAVNVIKNFEMNFQPLKLRLT